MTEPDPRPSVIICTYAAERARGLLEAVESVRAQTALPLEVIVAVDHNEELARYLEVNGPRDIRVARNAETVGLAETRNVGARVARSAVLAFLDDDAIAEPDWLARLVGAFRNPQVAAVGGRIVPMWPQGGRPVWFPEELDWVVGCTYAGLPVADGSLVRNVIGCNMAVRRTVLELVGFFRSALGRVGKRAGQAEETDLCLRIQQRVPGSVILYEPRAVVYHRVPPERLRLGFLLRRSYEEGFCKSRMKQLVGATARSVLRTEISYLRHLVRFLGDRVAQGSRPGTGLQIGTVLLSLGAVGVGYLAAELGRRGIWK